MTKYHKTYALALNNSAAIPAHAFNRLDTTDLIFAFGTLFQKPNS